VNFFMVYDIDIDRLNFKKFRKLNFLHEIYSKNVFFAFVLK